MNKLLYIFVYISEINFSQLKSLRRVTHGTRPPSFTYPYSSQVRLTLLASTNLSYTCSGTIISEQVILTAAHCLVDKIEIVVQFNSFLVEELVNISVKEWIIHPLYLSKNLDLGLVITENSLPLTSIVQAVYPSRWITNSDSLYLHSRPSLACGWGQNEYWQFPNITCLEYTKLDQKCLFEKGLDPEFTWCFYNPPSPDGMKDTYSTACYGDSGSGIFPDYEDNDWKLFAVTKSISNDKCRGEGETYGIQITPSISDWIIERLLLVHQSNCSFQMEN